MRGSSCAPLEAIRRWLTARMARGRLPGAVKPALPQAFHMRSRSVLKNIEPSGRIPLLTMRAKNLPHETKRAYADTSGKMSQRGACAFLRGIRMYHDKTMLENARAMPREAAIVLSI